MQFLIPSCTEAQDVLDGQARAAENTELAKAERLLRQLQRTDKAKAAGRPNLAYAYAYGHGLLFLDDL
jgi:hypothetical protein